MAALAGSSLAATILYDQFTDGDRAKGSDPKDTAWYTAYAVSGSSLNVVSGENNGLEFNPGGGGNNSAFVGSFPTQTMAKVGDKITLSLDFQFVNAPGGTTTDSQIRVGFYNDNGTKVNKDDQNTTAHTTTDDYGYSALVQLSRSGQSAVGKESGGAGNILAGTDLSQNSPETGNPHNGTALHHLVLTLELLQGGGVQISYKMGDLTDSYSDTSSPYTSFNEVAIGLGKWSIMIFTWTMSGWISSPYHSLPPPSFWGAA